jgi:hypothetical protein
MKSTHAALQSLAAAGARAFLCCAAMVGVLSCGGGGGDGPATREQRPEGVYSGFSPAPGITLEQALNWEYESTGGGDGGVGPGADGDGGVGAGGDFGQFRNARVRVRYPDGTLVGGGEALTDANSGMVTIVPRKGYRGPLLLELHGGGGATYYEEGKDTFVDFPAGQVIRAVVPSIDRNIGITPFSEAAFRLLTEGATPERAANPAQPTAAEIAAANGRVRTIVNRQFPAQLAVDDITRLPFIKSPTIGAGSIGIDARGRYGLVNGAFSKQAAMFNPGRTQPTLDAVAQIGADLLDGVLDGMNGNQSAVGAGARTYDPHTLTGELSSALAEQSYRFGNNESQLALPKVLNFANSRYEGYLFDASLTAAGQAFDTVVGWVGDNSRNRTIGQAFNKLPNEARVFTVLGNFGHGSLFFRANTGDSQPKTYVVGDNVNGELGLGHSNSTSGQAVEIELPGVPTHVAGGFAHTLARMADGAVYAWGDNSSGQLGTGGTAASTTPVRVTLPRGALAVAATTTASYALLDDGSVYAWGASSGFGLLGDGNKNSARATPAPITSLSGVVQITARDNDVAVLRKDGSVWHWGSFPADPQAFTPGDVSAPYAGGTPQPAAVTGLPAGVEVRKVLTEQGVFAALLANGAVYEWGVYFDITADSILRDIEARRVLSLPPIRDMMPGGFIGYGVRPFDRLTAMGVDYRGGMWKIRGRVAEEFDPANPTLQRRPLGQAPRTDCASCHIPLNDWPLTPDAPGNDVCQPPTDIHGGGNNGPSLIHTETVCEKCHNPARQPPAPMFPNGWLTCRKPTNLPPRSTPVPPPVVSNACTIPSGHTFTPPGTVCASCHNSVAARPLNCAQPPSGALPTLQVSATITRLLNDANAVIAAGSSTTDTTPTLQGTVSTALASGQVLRLLRNGTPIGAGALSGTSWSFTDPGASNGTQAYVARVEAGSDFGTPSSSYTITIDTAAPTQTTTVAISDDIVGPLPENPGFSSDTTPTVSGTLSAALRTGERVRVLRGGATIANLTASGTSWSFTEPSALAGATYAYTARVVDAAGNLGPLSASATVTVVTGLPSVTITRAANDNNATIAANGFTNDSTPTLQGTLSAALGNGQVVRVLRDGVPFSGTASVGGTNWNFTDSGAANGAHTYTARTEQGTVLGAPSAGYAFTVDTVAPTQTANVAQIFDDISGDLANNASTSDSTPGVRGTVTATLGPNESLQLLRNQTVIATLTVSGTAWTFTEPAALAGGTYEYAARAIDAAGNMSVAVGAMRSVVINTSFPLAGAATVLNTINGVAPSGGAVPVNNINAPVLAGTIQRALNATAPNVEVVRVYREGQAVGTANVSGTSWTFTSAALADGTYRFLARIERSSDAATFGQPSSSVSDPIDTGRPSQTPRITASSNVAPSLLVAGNDSTPTIRVNLDAALASGETLVVTRTAGSGTPETVASFTAGGGCSPVTATCFQFTDDTKQAIPLPPLRISDALTPQTTPSDAAPTSYTYTAQVRDAAGNLGANTASTSFQLGHLACNQARADASADASTGRPHPAALSFEAARTGNCSGCHRTQPPGSSPNGTPAGTFVAVPRGATQPETLPAAAYWCRRPP